MTPTEYLRQVPIKHWLPMSYTKRDNHLVIDITGPHIVCQEETTGYKTQRAWDLREGFFILDRMPPPTRDYLAAGFEVEGFEWIDLPVKE